jgi:hypothetical protein
VPILRDVSVFVCQFDSVAFEIGSGGALTAAGSSTG